MGAIADLTEKLFGTKKELPVCPHGEPGGCARCFMSDIEAPTYKVRDLDETDLQEIVNSLPAPVLTMLKENPEKVYLGGGYIRAKVGGERVNDIDLFVGNMEREEAQSLFADYFPGSVEADNCFHWTETSTRHAKGGEPVPYPVQFVYRWKFTNAIGLIRQFDLSIAQAAIWYEADKVWCGFKGICCERFYPDVASKRLVFMHPPREGQGGGYIARILKFVAQGYWADSNNLADMIAESVIILPACQGVDVNSLRGDLYQAFEKMRQGKKPSWDSVNAPIETRKERLKREEDQRQRSSYSYS